MRTKSITLFYKATQQEIVNPPIKDLERKERWIQEVQNSVEADYKPITIKVKYELFNPEVLDQIKFFNGTVIMYYAIQNEEMLGKIPDRAMLDDYRELILDEMLGYDLRVIKKTIRKRKSCSDFKTVQAWNNFLKKLEEDMFENSGYDFPDSEEFWELEAEVGYEEAKKISIQNLQNRLAKRIN